MSIPEQLAVHGAAEAIARAHAWELYVACYPEGVEANAFRAGWVAGVEHANRVNRRALNDALARVLNQPLSHPDVRDGL